MLKKIDIHIHTSMWKDARINSSTVLANPEQIREKYRQLGIEKGVLLPLISPECRFCIQTNEETEYIANKYSDLFYWFCNIDPRMGENSPTTDFSYFLEAYKKRGARGVGEITANLYADDPLMDNLFYHCGECDMPVIIHIAPHKYGCYGIIDELGLPRIEKMLKNHPKLKIIGHSQCFWSEIDSKVSSENRSDYPGGAVTPGRVAELMREYGNLYGDLSAGSGYNAMARDPESAYKFIEEFADRLMFGTDICSPSNEMLLSSWLDRALAAGCISSDAYRKISRENAIKILNLN